MNFLLKVKFQSTERISAIKYMGPYSFCMIFAKLVFVSIKFWKNGSLMITSLIKVKLAT
ncbi:MAG: hypothetical protein L6V88_09755 [Anaerotruncus sp.]|nr:MAG: hypothetical protein L6V88_09755 [Anaerotruncus sp.]